MNKIIIITIILVIIFLLYYNTNNNFEAFNNNYDLYVITLKNYERLNNIKNQENKYEIKINIFDAVDGVLLNQYELIKNGLLSEKFSFDSLKRNKEIACYQSHLNILEFIKNNSDKKYSIIFEDDFLIKNDDFINIIEKIISYNLYFDVIFLGNPNNNYGNHIIDNVYDFDDNNNLWGAYAYMINNENIDKIINNINYIEKPIDIKYEELGKNKKLIIYMVYPTIISTDINLLSTILN